MDFLNAVLTFPGKIIANLLYDYLGIVWLIVLSIIIGLFVAHYLYKKREFFHIALILSSILLAFTPSAFKFASYESKLFWVFIFLSVAIGFVYYFIDKDNSLTLHPIAQQENRPAATVSNEMEQTVSSLNLATIKSVLYRNYYIFLILLIFVLAFYLRTFQIEKYPAGYGRNELLTPLGLIKYNDWRRDLTSYFSLFQREFEWPWDSPIMMGLAIPFYKIFDISMVSSRYFSVFWGMMGLFFLFLYLREHFPEKSAIFLFSFTALELINVVFSRLGTYNIPAFTYTVFILYLLEITFKQKNLFLSIPLSVFLGFLVLASYYIYFPARAVMLIVIVILLYKALFKKAFIIQKWIPLSVFFLTFFGAAYLQQHGNLKGLWPRHFHGYLNINQYASLGEFIKAAFDTLVNNFKITFNRIVFIERAGDSLSKFKDGGLLSGLALCFIPFALGFALAGIRRERHFSIIVISFITLLPAILAGIPNARRLLLFLSLLLAFSGLTAYVLFDQLQKVVSGKMKEFVVLIPAAFFFLAFSYNLYIYIDIHSNMVKKEVVYMPFTESGLGDVRYSRYISVLAKEIGEFIKENNVFFYYSDVYIENPAAPIGADEQLLVESYHNSQRGGKLVWMNAFRAFDTLYFHEFKTALKMIQDSDRDVKVIFIKPLADEMGIYEKLKDFFPHSQAEERTGDNEEFKVYILSISQKEINQTKSQPVSMQESTLRELSGEALSRLLKENINTHFHFNGYFFLAKDTKIKFKNKVFGLFDIAIDNYKLTKETQYLSLLKGIHQLQIKPLDEKPFTVIDTGSDKPQDFSAPFITVAEAAKLREGNPTRNYPHRWSLEKSIPYSNPSPTHSFYYAGDGHYVYSYFYLLYSATGQRLLLHNYYSTSKILQRDGKSFAIHYNREGSSAFIVYDPDYKKIKEISLDGLAFDLFFGDGDELYITYLNKKKITVIKPGYIQETWDTSPFSDFPIWNGDVDNNGDIILLSGDGKVFIFDKNRNLYRSFNVDTSWLFNFELLRYGGGIIITNSVIHILDPVENTIKSYDKQGHRLYYKTMDNPSLFRILPQTRMDFIQKLDDKIIFLGREGPQKEIFIYRLEKRQ